MGFWDTVLAALVATLIGVALVGIGGWAWGRARGPRVLIRVFGSTHSPNEPWLRWYHAEVLCETDAVARHPELKVRPPDSQIFEQWAWPGHALPEAIRRTPHLIPIVLGNIDVQPHVLSNGMGINPHNWFLTPDGLYPPGRSPFGFAANATHLFTVRVSWLQAGREVHRDADFRFTFDPSPTTAPKFEQVERHSRARKMRLPARSRL